MEGMVSGLIRLKRHSSEAISSCRKTQLRGNWEEFSLHSALE